MKRCGECTFHEGLPNKGRDAQGNEVPVGVCMRYPPQAMTNGNFQPPVVGSTTGWCGEFVAVHSNSDIGF